MTYNRITILRKIPKSVKSRQKRTHDLHAQTRLFCAQTNRLAGHFYFFYQKTLYLLANAPHFLSKRMHRSVCVVFTRPSLSIAGNSTMNLSFSNLLLSTTHINIFEKLKNSSNIVAIHNLSKYTNFFQHF